MNIVKILRETFLTSQYITENESKQLIIVDVQQEYANSMPWPINEFCQWLNEESSTFSKITFLYNGPDMGFSSEHELQYWYEKNELDEDVIHSSDWYDKGYAFFRYCIDSGIEDEDVATLVRYMDKNDISDSRDIDEDVWNAFLKEYPLEDVKELLQDSGDMIHLPDLMDKLKYLPNDDIILVGGSSDACLKEVEIALMALEKPFTRMERWIYYG